MFFSLLPNVEFSQHRNKYRFTDQDFVVAKNIFRNLTFDNSAYATDLFAEFTVKDGARPDYIAELLYNDPGYDWVLLLTNRITNLYNDWSLSSASFEKYIFQKYENPLEIKHWQTIEVKNYMGEVVQPAGIVVYYDPANPSSYTLRYIRTNTEEIATGNQILESVSYYEYEQELNTKKAIIQVLKPTYLNQFVKLFKIAVGYLPNELSENVNMKRTLNTSNIFNNITL
jgi:hypothetical protein